MHSFRILLTVALLFISVNALKAGTLMLMGIGLPTTGGGPPSCSNKLDFSDACNSQYIPAVFQ